jgi:hypothetical protein
MKKESLSLIKETTELRIQMYTAAKKYGLTHPLVLEISQALDQRILFFFDHKKKERA